jgi:hypothetical protein
MSSKVHITKEFNDVLSSTVIITNWYMQNTKAFPTLIKNSTSRDAVCFYEGGSSD